MKFIILILIYAVSFSESFSQTIYSKVFGNSNSKPVIFLHGGPGYNSAAFESTTAQRLADSGFYVIVYDRRGEGRSIDPNAKYTFQQTFDDLNNIYNQYNIKKAVLIGHSFGGIAAVYFAEKYPEKVDALLLASAPVSLQETFKNILTNCKKIYLSKNDSQNLNYIGMLEKMDTTSLEYSSYCFGHAMQSGAYKTKSPDAEAQNIYASFKTDTILSKYAGQMTYQAPMGFWKNEHYTVLDLNQNIQNLKSRVKIYGIYGKDDGLYSAEQIHNLENLIGKENLVYLDNCSHAVFMDRQTAFINQFVLWFRK